MAWQEKKEYRFSEEDEKKVFNLILKNTIEKELIWTISTCMYTGIVGNDKILFYRGETRTGISIQNNTEYAFFTINKEQEELLKNLISGTTSLRLENSSTIATNLWSGKVFNELPKTNLELNESPTELKEKEISPKKKHGKISKKP